MLPFLLAAGTGCWNASRALYDRADSVQSHLAFMLALALTGVAAGLLASSVQGRSSWAAPVGVLAVGGTYVASLAAHRAGPLSASGVGLCLVAIAYATNREIAAQQAVPVPAVSWTWRMGLAVAGAAGALDVVVAVLARGGAATPGLPSTVAVAAACTLVMALAAAVTVLAEGPPAWLRPGGRTGENTPL